MPSSYTARNRLTQQFVGENINTWGDILNVVLGLIDAALDDLTTIALTGAYSLTSTNGMADEARSRILKFTGTGDFTVTIPSVEKWYIIWNACSGTVTLTTGAGTTADVATGEIAWVICDGSNVKRSPRMSNLDDPTDPQDAATKQYVDDTAFAQNAGILPGQPGNGGKFLGTDGSVAAWTAPTTSQITDYAAREAALIALAAAFAVAL